MTGASWAADFGTSAVMYCEDISACGKDGKTTILDKLVSCAQSSRRCMSGDTTMMRQICYITVTS